MHEQRGKEMTIQGIIDELRIRADEIERAKDPAKQRMIIEFLYAFIQLALNENR
jgi:hypothetical protein